MKTRLKAILLLFLLFTSKQLLGASSEKSKQIFDALNYPTARYPGGILSLSTGIVTSIGGFIVLNDLSKSQDQQLVGLVAGITGTVTALDGLVRIVLPSSMEWTERHYNKLESADTPPMGKSAEEYLMLSLEYNATKAKRNRIRRGVVDLISSACYFYVFARGGTRGYADKLYIPGSIVALSSAYRFFFDSNEEQVWKKFGKSEATSFNWFWAPTGDGAQLVSIYRF